MQQNVLATIRLSRNCDPSIKFQALGSSNCGTVASILGGNEFFYKPKVFL